MNSYTLSVIAIIISIGTPVFEYLYNRRVNDINIAAHYFDAVYEEYLLVRIPNCRIKIERKSNGEVSGIDEFIELLREIRKKSLYFKFTKEDFYKEVYALIQELEDELVTLEEQVDNEKYKKFQISMDSKIRDIYECIDKTAHSKNFFMP